MNILGLKPLAQLKDGWLRAEPGRVQASVQYDGAPLSAAAGRWLTRLGTQNMLPSELPLPPPQGYRRRHKILHPGDNILDFNTVVTRCGVVLYVARVIECSSQRPQGGVMSHGV